MYGKSLQADTYEKKKRKERDGARKSRRLQCDSEKVSTRLLESPKDSTSQKSMPGKYHSYEDELLALLG